MWNFHNEDLSKGHGGEETCFAGYSLRRLASFCNNPPTCCNDNKKPIKNRQNLLPGSRQKLTNCLCAALLRTPFISQCQSRPFKGLFRQYGGVRTWCEVQHIRENGNPMSNNFCKFSPKCLLTQLEGGNCTRKPTVSILISLTLSIKPFQCPQEN